jgi:hypothetical protein
MIQDEEQRARELEQEIALMQGEGPYNLQSGPLTPSMPLQQQTQAEDPFHSQCGPSIMAEPPELFQLKCLSHASGAVTHLNRNNPSVPQI